MNDFLSWVKEAFNSRFWSTMYGTFILARLTTNWKFWFISFFVNESFILEKYSLLRNEYLVSLYPLSWFWNWLRTISKLILIPAIATYLVHWIFSKVETKVYRKWLLNKTEKKIIKANEEKRYQETISDTLNLKKENIKKEIQIKEESKKIKTNEDIWMEEYNQLFHKESFKTAMRELNQSIYSDWGNIHNYDDYWRVIETIIWESGLAILDSNWLINLDLQNNKTSMTEKWKFFMKNYIKNIT